VYYPYEYGFWIDMFGIKPDNDYTIWGWNKNEPWSNEYRSKTCGTIDYSDPELAYIPTFDF